MLGFLQGPLCFGGFGHGFIGSVCVWGGVRVPWRASGFPVVEALLLVEHPEPGGFDHAPPPLSPLP